MSVPIKSENTLILVSTEPVQNQYTEPTEHLGLIKNDTVSLPFPEFDAEEEYVIGAGRKSFDYSQGNIDISGGSVPVTLTDGRPLAFLLGSENYDNTTETHTLTAPGETDGLPISQTIQQVHQHDGSVIVYTFTGAVVGSGSISNETDGGELVVELDYSALDYTDTETFTGVQNVTELDDSTWSFKDVSSNFTIFNTEFCRLQDFELEIGQNISSDYYMCAETDGKPKEITYGNFDAELSATVTITDKSLYTELVNGDTKFDGNIQFTRDNGDTLDINLSGCKIRSAPHDVPEEGKIDVDVTIAVGDVDVEMVDTIYNASYL